MECRLPSFPRSFSSFCLDPSPDRKSDNTNDDARVLSSLLYTGSSLLSQSLTHSLMPDRSLSISRRDVSHSPRARTDDTCGLPHKHHNSVTRSFRGQTNSRSFRKLINRDRLKMVPRLETRPRGQRRPGCNTQPRDHSSADPCTAVLAFGVSRITSTSPSPFSPLLSCAPPRGSNSKH